MIFQFAPAKGVEYARNLAGVSSNLIWIDEMIQFQNNAVCFWWPLVDYLVTKSCGKLYSISWLVFLRDKRLNFQNLGAYVGLTRLNSIVCCSVGIA